MRCATGLLRRRRRRDHLPATSNGKQAVVVSQDNGITWTVRPVPGSAAGNSDPSVAIGAGGRVYLAYDTLLAAGLLR